MPTLHRLYRSVQQEFLGEPFVDMTDNTLVSFHRTYDAVGTMLDVAREVAAMLGFPRYSLSVSGLVDSGEVVYDPDVLTSGPKYISRVLAASFDGFSVREGSLSEVREYQQQPGGARWPRAWCWDERRGAFMWGPLLTSAGSWRFELVGDDAIRFASVAVIGGEERPDISMSEVLGQSIGWLENEELWGGLYPEWSQVVKWGTLMRLHMKERNTEQVQLYGAMYQKSLGQFAEFLRVPLPGALMEAKA